MFLRLSDIFSAAHPSGYVRGRLGAEKISQATCRAISTLVFYKSDNVIQVLHSPGSGAGVHGCKIQSTHIVPDRVTTHLRRTCLKMLKPSPNKEN